MYFITVYLLRHILHSTLPLDLICTFSTSRARPTLYVPEVTTRLPDICAVFYATIYPRTAFYPASTSTFGVIYPDLIALKVTSIVRSLRWKKGRNWVSVGALGRRVEVGVSEIVVLCEYWLWLLG